MKTTIIKKSLLIMASVAMTGLMVGCDKADEEGEVPSKLGYWYHDQFIELQQDNSNIYFVQPRLTNSPISKKKVEKILSSLHVEYFDRMDSEGSFMVTSTKRPKHSDLYVSDHYQLVSSSSRLYVLPQICIHLDKEGSLDAILKKHGKHLTLKETINRPDDSHIYYLDCDFMTSAEVLRLAAEIHDEPTIIWSEPNMLSDHMEFTSN